MHPPEVRAAAMELGASGLNDCEVARRTGVPRSTVRDWRRPPYARTVYIERCPRCWVSTRRIRFTPPDYAELLGMYLGDGSIATGARTQRLRITLDERYPGIIAETRALLERCFPEHRVDEVGAPGCVVVSLYCSHLSCLFPQHGSGKKHERQILLEDWQDSIISSAPWPFLRGLIRTDGCVFVNRTDVHRDQPYEYLTYSFTNKSDDIARLFLHTCSSVGVVARANRDRRGRWQVRINRRASVAKMLGHIGTKR